MAYLRNLETSEKLYLFSHHTFGRRLELVDTPLPQAEISKIHAAIEWNGQEWQIRDLGRNGTWLDQAKLNPAENTPLALNQQINFAKLPHYSWVVEDLSPPCNLLVGLNAASPTESLSNYHLLPNTKDPIAALAFSHEQGSWHLEALNPNEPNTYDYNEVEIPANGTISIGKYQWQLFLNAEQAQTLDQQYDQVQAENCAFHFEVSLDEEHTLLNLENQHQKISLGERSHHYLLLHLARVKAEHAKQGIDEKSQGWINNEQLSRELGIDVPHINIQIFRARKQISDAFPDMLGLSELLQRRRGSVRFNCPQARVSKGQQTEVLGI